MKWFAYGAMVAALLPLLVMSVGYLYVTLRPGEPRRRGEPGGGIPEEPGGRP